MLSELVCVAWSVWACWATGAHYFPASTARVPAWFCPLFPRHTPSDQTVCDLTRKLAKGNTLPDPGGKKPAGGNKEFSEAHS